MKAHVTARKYTLDLILAELGRRVHRTKVEKSWRIGDKTYAWALLLFAPGMPETPWVVGISEYNIMGEGDAGLAQVTAMDCWPLSSLDNATRLFGFLAEKQPRVSSVSPDLGSFVEPGESVWLPIKGADRRAAIIGGIVKSVIDRWPIGASVIEHGHTFCRGIVIPNVEEPTVGITDYNDRSQSFIRMLKPADRRENTGQLLQSSEDWKRYSAMIETERKAEIELNQKYGIGQREIPLVAYHNYVSPFIENTAQYVIVEEPRTAPRRRSQRISTIAATPLGETLGERLQFERNRRAQEESLTRAIQSLSPAAQGETLGMPVPPAPEPPHTVEDTPDDFE